MECYRSGVIVVCCILLHMSVVGSNTLLYHTIKVNGTLCFLVSQTVAYLLYPLLGWLADVYFTRYKFVKYSFIAMLLGSLLMCACGVEILVTGLLHLQPKDHISNYILIPAGISLVSCLVSLGLFESTAIQFGMDQMLEDPSENLSSFIHWYFWSSFLGQLVLTVASEGVLYYFSACYVTVNITSIHQDFHKYEILMANLIIIGMSVTQFFSALVGIVYLIYWKRYLVIDKVGNNPFKLIYKVIKYAWNHTYPENRSAFTYWENDIPKRIDLGKSKYGGPFTTEEVEDTKTFLSIILLLVSLLGFQLTGYGYSIEDQLMRRFCPTVWVIFVTGDPMQFVLITIVIGVPFYQLVFVRFYHKYSPNMLKRIGLGLLCCMTKELFEIILQSVSTDVECHREEKVTFISCYFLASDVNLVTENGSEYCSSIANTDYTNCTQQISPFIWLPVSSILHGLSFILVFMTALEFISAQAPLRLKGLLVGLLYSSLAIKYLTGVAEAFTTKTRTWQIFQGGKLLIMVALFIFYICVSRHYRYRLRDEVVNERFLVEEIYERELSMLEQDNEANLELDIDDDSDTLADEAESLTCNNNLNVIHYGTTS